MPDIDLKAATPDTTLPTTGFLFGADSQAAASPSVYSTQTVATTLLGSTSLTGATVTTSSPVIDAAQTWNDGAVTFTGLRFNAATGSNTGSAAASLLMDLQLEGTSRFSVRKDGYTIFASTLVGNTGSGVGIGYSAQGRLTISSGGRFEFGSSGVNSPDTFLTRKDAANIRLGAADGPGTPVAQTLSVQSVTTPALDTAGANLTITGSQGTGTGAGGSIIFQVAPAGSSGTAQNALADALTINSAQQVVMPASPVATTPRYSFGNGTSGLGFINNSLRLVVNGSLVGTFSATFLQLQDTSATFYLGSDVVFTRDAANTLALRNGVNAQALRVYNTYTSATDFERGNIFWDSNVLKIGTEKGSAGGTARTLEFQTDGTTRLTIQATSNNVIGAGSFYAQSAAGFFMNNRAGIQSSADGILKLVNWATTDFNLLQFGGTTSSFPALKRSTTSLQARLADDSAFTNIQGKLTTETAYTAGAPTATGYLVLYDSNGTAYKVPAEAL